jgi:hypothetical protein
MNIFHLLGLIFYIGKIITHIQMADVQQAAPLNLFV